MLNETKVKTAKPKEKAYKITDSHGLYIEIKPTGLKVWRYRYRIDGKETNYTIGEYPAIGLAEARKRHQDARQMVRDGISPVQARVQAKAKQQAESHNTFDAMAERWISDALNGSTDGYIKQTRASLKNDILPVIGKKQMNDITSADVLAIIENTIKRVRAKNAHGTGEAQAIVSKRVISGVFQYAIMRLKANTDPTYPVRRVIKRPPVQHSRALSNAELSAVLYKLGDYQGRSVRDCILFMMLTMVRTKEARFARWQDINFDDGLWTIPAEFMKGRKTHFVPLSKQAISIIKTRFEYRDSDWVFSSPQHRSKELGATTINRALEYMGCDDVTGHDFRATASTILNANGFYSDWIERQLAHIETNAVRRSYNHADHLQERRQMLQWWADYLDGLKVA